MVDLARALADDPQFLRDCIAKAAEKHLELKTEIERLRSIAVVTGTCNVCGHRFIYDEDHTACPLCPLTAEVTDLKDQRDRLQRELFKLKLRDPGSPAPEIFPGTREALDRLSVPKGDK